MGIELPLLGLIRRGQGFGAGVRDWRNGMIRKEFFGLTLGPDGKLRFHDRICVPQDEELRKRILREVYSMS